MFRTSLNRLLLVIILLLGAVGIAVTLLQVSDAWQNAVEKGRIAALAQADRVLFDAVAHIRTDRGNVQSALLGEDDAKPTIDKAKATATDKYRGMVAALQKVSIPGRDKLIDQLNQRWAAFEPKYQQLYAEAAKPRGSRSVPNTSDWYNSAGAVIATANAASGVVSNEIRILDPNIAELVQVRRFAWLIRDRYGLQCSLQRLNINTSKPLEDKQRQTLERNRGMVLAGWSGLEEIVTRDGIPPSIAKAVQEGKAAYDKYQADVDGLIAKLDGSGKPVVAPVDWDKTCQGPFNPIVGMAFTALDDAIADADAGQAAAQQGLILSGVALAAALLIALFGIVTLRRRFGRPVQDLLGAVDRLRASDFNTPVPPARQPDELGRIGMALEGLRESAGQAKRLEEEERNRLEQQQRQQAEEMARNAEITREIAAFCTAVSDGRIDSRIAEAGKDGVFLDFSRQLNGLAGTLDRMIGEFAAVVSAMSEGDVTQAVSGDYRGAFGNLKASTNRMGERLNTIARQLGEAARTVQDASAEISTGSQDLAQRTESQAASIEETAASMHEITTTVKQNADNAQAANQLATAARDTAQKGGSVVQDAVKAVTQIEESARKIADIVGLIDEIAFQTNLLALNASVEAARAGEAGKGFAVVAQEVRALAQRSANASKDIKALIGASNAQVKTGAQLVNQTGASLEDIVNAIKKVSDIVAEIAAASREQATGLDQINTAVGSMDEMTQRNGALVEETSASAQALADQARQLADLVGFFRTK
jgi:methyl-accepting chemotaxis protein